jgi:hypothetical protein
MCRSTSSWSLAYRLSISSQVLVISGPVNGTSPNEAAAVSCSERCKRGLLRACSSSGVSKFGGSAAIALGADASAGTRSLQPYHHAMSWGLTNDTVVHHGFDSPTVESHRSNCPATWGSTCQP